MKNYYILSNKNFNFPEPFNNNTFKIQLNISMISVIKYQKNNDY